MTPSNITSAFANTGIIPLNKQIFDDDDFLPSSVTDRPAPSTSQSTPSSNQPTTQPTTSSATTCPDVDLSQILDKDADQFPIMNDIRSIDHSHLKPEIVRPYPKKNPRIHVKKPRKKGRGAILTDTPEKLALIAKKQKSRKVSL